MAARKRIAFLLWFLAIVALLIFSLGARANPNALNLGGAAIADVSPALIDYFNLLPPYYGVVVTDVDPNSPAAFAGMRPGDMIQFVNSAQVQSATQLKYNLWRNPLDPAMFQVSRNGTVFIFTFSIR